MDSMYGRLAVQARGAPVSWRLRNYLRVSFLLGLLANLAALLFSRWTGIPTLTATLRARLFRADGTVVDYGLLSCRVVTTVFVNLLVDSMQDNSGTLLDEFRHHDVGTGSTAESSGDTALDTAAGVSRESGTRTEGASANIYRTVATFTWASGSTALVEHGVFDAASTGNLLDRSVFSAINVEDDDTIEFTYDLTVNAGG